MSVDKHIKDFAEIENQKTLVYQIIRDIFVAFEVTEPDEMENITDAILESLDNLINFKSYLSTSSRALISASVRRGEYFSGSASTWSSSMLRLSASTLMVGSTWRPS